MDGANTRLGLGNVLAGAFELFVPPPCSGRSVTELPDDGSDLGCILDALSRLRGEHGNLIGYDVIQTAAESQARQVRQLLGTVRSMTVLGSARLAASNVLDEDGDAPLRVLGQRRDVD